MVHLEVTEETKEEEQGSRYKKLLEEIMSVLLQ